MSKYWSIIISAALNLASSTLAIGQETVCPIILNQPSIITQQRTNSEDSFPHIYSNEKQISNGNIIEDSTNKANLNSSKEKELKPSDYLLYYVYNYDFYTTFIAQQSVNAINPSTDMNNIYLYYNITFNSRVNIKKFRWNFYLFNEYGARKYFDSISVKTDDLYYFKNTINYPIIKDIIAFNIMANIKSQFWNKYDYREDSIGRRERYTYATYFTPGYILYSSGITINFWEESYLELGLVSGRITKMKHQYIYEERESDKLYGLEKGTKSKVQFGINLQFNIINKQLGKHLIWEHFSQTYMPNEHYGDISFMTFEMNNALHYLFLKHMRLSLRTKVNYDQNIQHKPQIINQLSIGFYLTNVTLK